MEFVTALWDQALVSDDVIQSLQHNGVSAIETDPDFMFDNNNAAVIDARRRFEQAGIRIYSCHAPFGSKDDLSSIDPEQWQYTIDRHLLAVRQAAAAGARTLVIHPSSKVPPDERVSRRTALFASLECLIPAAEHAGITLALENMLSGQLCDSSAELLEIVNHFDSPTLGICFDAGHFHVTREGVVPAFERLKDRIVHFHLQDNDSTRDLHLQPPYGTIDWDALLPLIAAENYPFPCVVEAVPWNNGSWHDLLREVSALSRGELLSIDLNGRPMRVVCPKCHRYCFGTIENWSCGCA